MSELDRLLKIFEMIPIDASTPGPRYCQHCGGVNDANATYCVGCGKLLNS